MEEPASQSEPPAPIEKGIVHDRELEVPLGRSERAKPNRAPIVVPESVREPESDPGAGDDAPDLGSDVVPPQPFGETLERILFGSIAQKTRPESAR